MNINLNVKHKLFILFITVIVISVNIIGWYGFKSAKDSYINSALLINEGETHGLSNEISGLLGTIPDDVLYNANFYALEKMLIWEDLQESEKTRSWKKIYLSTLKDYLHNKKLYYQIRILDINGKEKILLKYDEKTDTVIQTSEDMLQNKAHRDYYKEAIKLKKREFYISEMNLNVEKGHIEKPHVPVVRYSTPIVDANGETKGVIVLNFSAKNILDKILESKIKAGASESQGYYLLNEDGYYLFHSDKIKRWGFQLGNEYNFKIDYKGIFDKFKDKDEANFIQDGKIYSVHKIYPYKSDNSYRYWYLITVVDESVALSSLDTFINIFLIIFISVLVIGLGLIGWYVSKLINPLSRVSSVLQALSKGEIKKDDIFYKAKDEIGEIVNSSAILVEAIETTIKQANLVADGDFSKEITLLGKNDALGESIKEMTARLKEITELSTSLSKGNYDVSIFPKGSNDKLGLALLDMVKYLKEITNVAELIAQGELDINHKVKSQEDRLGVAILDMIDYLKAIQKQAEAISNDDFTISIKEKSKNDELSLALISMTDILKTTSDKTKKDIYLSDGLSGFSNVIAGLDEQIKLSKTAISEICRYIDASSGVVYSFDKEKTTLNMIASFSFITRENLSNQFKLGEGVVGQVALECEPILLKNVKDQNFEVRTGTTSSKPKEVYTFPIINEGELLCVIEVMSFESFSDIKLEYLQKSAHIFATTYKTTAQNSQIKELLEKSQLAFEELQIKSEELQESNVQMEEQQQQLETQSEELRHQNDTLEVAKKEIDKRAEELERASKYKSEFLANMSHELRTPLNSIILLSKLLSQNQDDTLGDKDIEKSKVIHKAGNDLLLLINDILDLSKIESGNMELIYEEIKSSEILEDIRGLFSPVADDRKIRFIIDDKFDSVFSTDKAKLSQVLKNLLSNAFKFTKEGYVEVVFEEFDNKLRIVVKDSGIGIPKDKLGTIFEAFKQVDGSISREFGGTGLGLSITKTIVDLMGGSVSVESIEGEGTAFKILLPMSEIKKVKELNKPVEIKSTPIFDEDDFIDYDSNELKGKNILLVDDDSRNIFTLTSVLENLDAEIYTAFNGKEAIEILEKEEKIDLILMDIMMPVMDGLKAIQNIKNNEKFRDIPIIAITAKTMQEDKQMCLDAGANDYLAKPLEHGALISMIKAWIK